MKLKPLALLVAALALVAGFVSWQRGKPVVDPSTDPRVGQALVANDTLSALRGLRLVAGGKSLTLTADAAGTQWTVPDYFGLPVDFGKLVGFVHSLRDVKVSRFVTTRADRLARLGFDGDLIELRGTDAKPLLTLHLGKNADSGGRFIKLNDEPKAYLVDFSAWLDTTAKNWANSQLLDVKAADIASIELRFADGSRLTAQHAEDGTSWTADNLPAGKELDASKLDSLVSQLASLRFTDTTEPTAPDAVAAKEHTQTVVVTTKDGTSYTIALGRRPAAPATRSAIPKADEAQSTQITATTPPIETPQPGPVFAFVSSTREGDSINTIMQQRSFQIGEWILGSIPTDEAAVLQDQPTAPAPSAPVQ